MAWIRIKLATCLPPNRSTATWSLRRRCCRASGALRTLWSAAAVHAMANHAADLPPLCIGMLACCSPCPWLRAFYCGSGLGPCSDAAPTSRLSTLPSCVCLLAQEAGLQRNPDHGHPGAGGQGAHPPTLCSDMPWPRSCLCCRRRRRRCWSCLQHTHPIPTAGLFLFRRSTPTTARLATTSPTSSACPPAAAPPTS